MTIYSYFTLIGRVFQLINLIWYLLLSPFFVIYLLLHASGIKPWLISGYDYILKWLTKFVCPTRENNVTSTTSIADNKQALDYVAGFGWFPMTVALGLFYVPFYFYTMVWWSMYNFLQWHIPLMYLFALVCCDDTHYDSHHWLTGSHKSVWYRHYISIRFKQYSQMIWFPLAQHLPHLHIHHKFNMKNQQDVDYNGCYQRDGYKDFLKYLSRYEWNYNWNSIQYFYTLPGSKILLRRYIKDLILNYGLLVFAACLGWQKFLFQYSCHCVCYCFVAWVTFYIEHPFHHMINNSYEHPWNSLTVVNSTTELSSESHTSHHIWPTRSMKENAVWANDPCEFATSQLKYRHLAISLNSSFEEIIYLPYIVITKQYLRLAQMLHFKDSDQLKAAGMPSHLIDAYQNFRRQCDEDEIKRRLQAR